MNKKKILLGVLAGIALFGFIFPVVTLFSVSKEVHAVSACDTDPKLGECNSMWISGEYPLKEWGPNDFNVVTTGNVTAHNVTGEFLYGDGSGITGIPVYSNSTQNDSYQIAYEYTTNNTFYLQTNPYHYSNASLGNTTGEIFGAVNNNTFYLETNPYHYSNASLGNTTIEIQNAINYTPLAVSFIDLWSMELLDDPSFDACTGNWTLGNGWSCSSGNLIHGEVAGGVVVETSPFPVLIGGIYNVTCVVTDDSGSGVGISFGGQSVKTPGVQATGTFNSLIAATSTSQFTIDNDQGGTGGGPVTITGCTIKKLSDLTVGNEYVYGSFYTNAIKSMNIVGTPNAIPWIMSPGPGADTTSGTAGNGGSMVVVGSDSGDSGGGSAGTPGNGTYGSGNCGGGNAPCTPPDTIIRSGRGNTAPGGNIRLQLNTDNQGDLSNFNRIIMGNTPGEGPGGATGGGAHWGDYESAYFGDAYERNIWYFDSLNRAVLDGGAWGTYSTFYIGDGTQGNKLSLVFDTSGIDGNITFDPVYNSMTVNASTFIVNGNNGDTEMWLYADSDNNGENDHPKYCLSQDGTAVQGCIGFETITDPASINNALVIENFYNGAGDGIVLREAGGARMYIRDTTITFYDNTFEFAGNSNSDITMAFTGTSSSGSFKWMEDENYFQFQDNVNMDGYLNVTGVSKLQGYVSFGAGFIDALSGVKTLSNTLYTRNIKTLSNGYYNIGGSGNNYYAGVYANIHGMRDAGIYLTSDTDGHMDVYADVAVDLNTPTVNATTGNIESAGCIKYNCTGASGCITLGVCA